MKNKRTFENLQGIWPVLVTPYNKDLSIDIEAYREILNWHLSFDLGGIYGNCLSSEMYELSNQERFTLIEEAAKTVNGIKPLAVTGNFGSNVATHIDFCNKAWDKGADVVMLTIPRHIDDPDELEKYFFTVANSTQLPLGIYECPVPRAFHLELDLIKKLADSGRFYAYKETSCRLDKIRAVNDITAGTNLSLLQANIPLLREATKMNVPGSMNVVANWLPDLTNEVFRTAKSEDPISENLHQQLCIMELAQRSIHPTGVKYLMQKRGLPINPTTRYQSKISEEVVKSIDIITEKWFDQNGDLHPDLGVEIYAGHKAV